MPTNSPRRRLTLSLTVGAVVGLVALAMPTAAHAAATCAPTTTPTAATQPWQDFSESPNKFDDIEAANLAVVPALHSLLATVDGDFTQADLDALNASIGTALNTAGSATQTAGDALEAQQIALNDALLAIDPASGPATQAILDSFNVEIEASQYGPPLTGLFNATLAAMGTYLQSVQAAIDASLTRPLVPQVTTDAINALAAAMAGFGAFAGDVIYGGAADQVVFTEACALAATGGDDPTPLALGGALLLLAGAGVVVAGRRRTAQ